MLKRIFVSLVGILLLSPMFGQVQPGTFSCGTEIPPIQPIYGGGPPCVRHSCDLPFNRDTSQFSVQNQVFTIHLLVHLVRDNNGNGPSIQDVEDLLEKTNRDFRGITADTYSANNGLGWTPGRYDAGIEFCWTIVVHDSTPLVTERPRTLASLPAYNQLPFQQVNVYLSNYNHPAGAQGYSSQGAGTTNILSTRHVWVKHNHVNGGSKTLSHELGHFFGLIHPFDFSGCIACFENLGQTLPQRDVLGDFCSDTDPDRQMASCTPPADTSCSGHPYTWNSLLNIMSYGNAPCSPRFSYQQVGRMRCYILNRDSLLLSYPQAGCPDVPTPDFTGSPRTICPGNTVQFTNLSSTNSVAFLWDFGDGSFSSQTHPAHTYANPGTYTVSLTAQAASGVTRTQVQTSYIIVTNGFSTPYLEPFTMQTGVPFGWEAISNTNRSNDVFWEPFRSQTFLGTRPGPRAEGHLNTGWQCLQALDDSTFWCVSPSLTDSSCIMVTSGVAPGDKDYLLSPVLDLTSLTNPTMAFEFSHLPTQSAYACPGTCMWNYPGLPFSIDSDFNAACSASYSPRSQCANQSFNPLGLEDTLIVEVTPDCGMTWDTVFIDWGENLNTVPGSECAPIIYAPLDTSVWRKVEFDLCQYAGAANVQFRFTWVQSYLTGRVFIDEFFVGNATSAPLSVSAISTDDCGLGTGTVQGTTTGGSGPLSYTLTNLGNGNQQNNSTGFFSGLFFGDYLLAVVDGLGNCAQTQVTVGQNNTLTATLTPINASCGLQNGQVNLQLTSTGATAYTYVIQRWGQTLDSLTSPNVNITRSGFGPGNYDVLVWDNIGNCGLYSFSIQNTFTLTPGLQITSPTCSFANGGINVNTPTGTGFSYALVNLSTGQTLNNSTGQFTGLGVGNYSVCADDGQGNCGCDTVSLIAPPNLTLQTVIRPDTCAQQVGQINVTANGGTSPYTFDLYDSFGNLVLSSGPQAASFFSFTGLSAGNYQLEANDALGGCGFAPVTVGSYNVLFLSAQTVPTTCALNDGQINASAQSFGPYNWTLSDTSGNTIQTGTSPSGSFSITGLSPGVYDLYVEDFFGDCNALRDTVQFTPTLGFSWQSQILTCAPFSASLNIQISGATGGLSANLQDTLGNIVSTVTTTQSDSVVFSPVAGGTWVVFVGDSLGNCTQFSIILAPNPLNLTAQIFPLYCQQGSDVLVTVFGAATWAGGSVLDTNLQRTDSLYALFGDSLLFENLQGGTYVIEVWDVAGCDTVHLSTPINPYPGSITVTQPTCLTGGSISMSATADSFSVTHLQTGNTLTQTSPVFNGLAPGTFLACALDTLGGCGCDTVEIAPLLPLSVTDSIIADTCFSASGEIWLSLPGGSGNNYTYTLTDLAGNILQTSGPGTGPQFGFTGLLPDTFLVSVDSAGGCFTDTLIVPVGQGGFGFQPLFQPISLPDCADSTAHFLWNYTIGNLDNLEFFTLPGGLSYLPGQVFRLSQNSWRVQGMNIGTYLVSVQDTQNGTCRLDTLVIPGFDTLAHSITAVHPKCLSSDGGFVLDLPGAQGQVSGQIINLNSFQTWNYNGLSGPQLSVSGFPAGTYSLYFEDSAGACLYETGWTLADTGCCYAPSPNVFVVGVDSISNLMALNASDTFLVKTIYIVDTLFIDSTAYFDKVNFKLETGGVVYVYPFDTMIHLSNCRYDTACGDSMWDGIYVQGGGGWTGEGTVWNSENGLVSENGGFLRVEGLVFGNNNHGIQLRNYSQVWPGTIHGTDFLCNPATMIPPFSGKRAASGVRITKMDSVVVGLPQAGRENYFTGMSVGIRVEESNAGIYQNVFEDIAADLDVDGGLIPETGTAILAVGQGSFLTSRRYRLTVGEPGLFGANDFSNCSYGVDARFHYRLLVRHNRFWDGTVQVTEGVQAIRNRLAFNMSSSIHDNEIENWTGGIELISMAGSQVEILDNLIENLTGNVARGIEVEDVSWNGLHPTAWVNTSYLIKDNQVNLSGVALFVQGARGVKIQDNSVELGALPPSSFGFGVRVDGSQGTEVRNNTFSYLPGVPATNVVGLYGRMAPENFIACNTFEQVGFPLVFEGLTSTGTQLWENELEDGVVGLMLRRNGVIGRQVNGEASRNQWQGTWASANTLADESDGSQSPIYVTVRNQTSAFFPNQNNSTGQIGFPIQIIQGQNSRFQPCTSRSGGVGPGTGSGTLSRIARGTASYNSLIEEFQAEGFLLGKLLTDSVLMASDPIYSNAFPGLSQGEQMGLFEVEDSLLAHFITSAKSINNGLYLTEVPAINQRELNKVLLKWLDSNGQGLETTDEAALLNIAVQCPQDGGFAVFPARSLLSAMGYSFSIEDSCLDFGVYGSPAKQSAGSELESPERTAFFYPNPARETITFEMGSDPANVRVIDLHGREITTFTLTVDNPDYLLEVGSWSRGIFLVEIIESGQVRTEKLVLQ